MGIDAKEIRTLLLRFLGCSLNSTLEFTRKHPVFSSISVFLLSIYNFLPGVFYFLVYSSPVLACVVVYALEKLNPRGLDTVEKRASSLEASKSGREKSVGRSHLIHQRSVRRNARMKVDKWDSRISDDDKDKVILTSLYNDLLGRTPHFEESPKAVEPDVVDFEKEEASQEAESLENSRPSFNDLGVIDVGKHILSSCECKEEEDKELNGGNKIEQKNGSNEPGIAELESQRLESLISRRRARRLFKQALDQKNMMRGDEMVSSMQNILQISVPKNSGSLLRNHRNNASEDFIGLQMPGSAPSVLLPMRNPFDIPYDPQEERPILKGDSFDLEFSVFNQKDLFFSRHESFCRSAFFSPDPAHYIDSPDLASERKQLDSGNDYENKAERELSPKGKKAENATKMTEDADGSVGSGKSSNRVTEVNEETDSNKESQSDSSSSGESEPEFSALNKAELREAIRHSMGNFSCFPMNQTRNNIPSPLPRGVPPRFDDHHQFYARRCSHTRTYSIASDLQVEVSEIGSPPTTVDWHDDSSNGGESYMYDTDIDREIVCGQELLERASHLPDSHVRSETRSNEENNGPELDIEDRIDEHTNQVVDEAIDQNLSNSSNEFEHVNSRRFERALFHTSASLSSIAEEPETQLDSVDAGTQESAKEVFQDLIDQRPLSSLYSSIENLGDDEANFQNMSHTENEELLDAENFDSEINGHAEKVKEEEEHIVFTEDVEGELPYTLYNHGKYDHTEVVPKLGSKVGDGLITEINRNLGFIEKRNTPDRDVYRGMLDNPAEHVESKVLTQPERVVKDKEMRSLASTAENAEIPTELEETQEVTILSPDHLSTFALGQEVVEVKEERAAENTDKIGVGMEQETTQNALNISTSNPHTESLKQELVEKQEAKFAEQKAEPTKQEESQNVSNTSAGHPHTESLEREAIEEPTFVENTDRKIEEIEREDSHSALDSTLGHLPTESLLQEGVEEKELNFVEEKAQWMEREEIPNGPNTSLGYHHRISLESEIAEPKFVNEKAEPMEHEETDNVWNAYGSHLHRESLEREVTAEKEQNFGETTYQIVAELTKPAETQNVPGASPGHPCITSVGDCADVKNASEVTVLQVNRGNSLRPDELNKQEILKKRETSSFIEDTDVKPIRECNNIVNLEDASVVSENTQNSHGYVSVAERSEPWMQQALADSSGESSSGTLSIITQQPEPRDINASNIDEDITHKRFSKLAEDSIVQEGKEEDQKPNEQSDKTKEEDERI